MCINFNLICLLICEMLEFQINNEIYNTVLKMPTYFTIRKQEYKVRTGLL
jgi:hypothetical protein